MGALVQWSDRMPLASSRLESVPVYREPQWPVVRVEVLQPFCLAGVPVQAGNAIDLIQPVAEDLIARGRAKVIAK